MQARALFRGQGAYFFLRTAECAKQSLDVSLKRIKKTRKWTCCPWILHC